MKDFYDLWTIFRQHTIHSDKLETAIRKVFANRNTPLEHPIAFTQAFYKSQEPQQRWKNFLAAMGKHPVSFEDVVLELSHNTSGFFEA